MTDTSNIRVVVEGTAEHLRGALRSAITDLRSFGSEVTRQTGTARTASAENRRHAQSYHQVGADARSATGPLGAFRAGLVANTREAQVAAAQNHRLAASLGLVASHARKAEAGTKALGSVHRAANYAVGVTGLASLAFGIKDVTTEALRAEAEQKKLQVTLTTSRISWTQHGKAVEDNLNKLSLWSGLAKSDLSVALGNMVRSTGSLHKSWDLLNTVMNVSRATGRDVASVGRLVARTYEGNFRGLTQLGLAIPKVTTNTDQLKASQLKLNNEIRNSHGAVKTELELKKQQLATLTKEAQGKDKMAARDQALAELNRKFAGQAAAYASSTQGEFDRAKQALTLAEEEIGKVLLPVLADVAKHVVKAATSFRENWPQIKKEISDTVGPIVNVVKGVVGFVAQHKPLRDMLLTITGLALAWKAITFAGQITGVTKLIALVRELRSVSAAAARANAAGTVAGAGRGGILRSAAGLGIGGIRGAAMAPGGAANPLAVVVMEGGGVPGSSPGGSTPEKVAKAGGIAAALRSGAKVAGGAGIALGVLDTVLPGAQSVRGIPTHQGATTANQVFGGTGDFSSWVHDSFANIKAGIGKLFSGDLGGAFSSIFGHQHQDDLRKFGDQLKALKGDLTGLSPTQLKAVHDEAVKLGNDKSLGKWKTQLDDIAKATTPLGQALEKVAPFFKTMSDSAGASLAQIKSNVSVTSDEIKNTLGTKTAEGRAALALNFLTAANDVKVSMADGVISTQQGIQAINDLMNQALKALGVKVGKGGLTNPQASSLIGAIQSGAVNPTQIGGTVSYPGHAARGGLLQLGKPGEAGRDTIPLSVGGTDIIAGAGEQVAILNRHQQKVVNNRLADLGGLPGLFSRVRTPNYMAGGGIVGKVSTFGPPNEPAGSTASGVSSALPGIALFDRNSPGGRGPTLGHIFHVVIGSHAANLRQTDVGPAPWTGRVIDVTGAGAQAMGIDPRGFPTDSIGSATPADGSSLTGAYGIGGKAGGSAAQIARVMAKGVSGAIGGLAQGVLDKVRGAANAYLAKQVPAGPGPGGVSVTPVGGTQGPAGLGIFDGIQVADWIIPELQYARAHGWTGHITSGYRPGIDQHTASGTSEHQGTQYPHGAVDFGGMVDPAGLANRAAFERAAAGYRGLRLLEPQGFRDDGHMSGTGHARGGLLAMAGGGTIGQQISQIVGSAPAANGPRRRKRGRHNLKSRLPFTSGTAIPNVAGVHAGAVKGKKITPNRKLPGWLSKLTDDSGFKVAGFSQDWEDMIGHLQADLSYWTGRFGLETFASPPTKDDLAQMIDNDDVLLSFHTGPTSDPVTPDGTGGIWGLMQGELADAKGNVLPALWRQAKDRQETLAVLKAAFDLNVRMKAKDNKRLAALNSGKYTWEQQVADNNERIAILREWTTKQGGVKVGHRASTVLQKHLAQARTEVQHYQAENQQLKTDQPPPGIPALGLHPTKAQKKAYDRAVKRYRTTTAHLTNDVAQRDFVNTTIAGSTDTWGTSSGVAGQYATDLTNVQGAADSMQNTIKTLVRDSLPNEDLAIRTLRKDIADLGATPPASPVDQSQLNSLLQQQLQDTLKTLGAVNAQFAVLSGFRPELGRVLVGAYERGTDYVPRTGLALVHEGEQIIPNRDGPYGHGFRSHEPGRGAPNITLHFGYDERGMTKLVDARIEGKAAKVVSEQLGRRARIIAGAPG